MTPTGALRLVAAAIPILAAGPADPAESLAGRYSRQFPNALVSGERYTSENIVEIVPVAPRAAYVRLELQFFNGHVCSLYGVARADRDALVYTEGGTETQGEERCRLRIARKGAALAWDDGGSCKGYCGARGSFREDGLPWASRRPIRYLPKLKASRQYRNALVEWRTGRPALP